MTVFNLLKDELLKINGDLARLLDENKDDVDTSLKRYFGEIKDVCSEMNRQIDEKYLRVAVVGTIKSGKSTFINSMFGGDFLKRGAGVVTSVVTRTRCADSFQVRIRFKSWDMVNEDIRQAMILFPSIPSEEETNGFDLRRRKDREYLVSLLNSLGVDQHLSKNMRNANSVQLSSYLNGYSQIKDVIGADPVIKEFGGDDFARHRKYVGEESLAVYVDDINLTIESDELDGNIEIADCQGSDSSNPLHLARIQDYLLRTNLIVYVISSRTGLREADIKFLSIIRKMGIIDNVLFVFNTDINEHEAIDDLKRLAQKVKDELSIIKPHPELFTLSALFNLFSAVKGSKIASLSPKDDSKFKLWNDEDEFIEFSNSETIRFNKDLNMLLHEKRYFLLLINHLERLSILGYGLEKRVHLTRDVLSSDVAGAAQIVKKIKILEENTTRVTALVKTALDGAISKIKSEISDDIDEFFDFHTDGVCSQIREFIKNYRVSYETYKDDFINSGFSPTLFLVFNEFKHCLDTHMAETAGPEILNFLVKCERKIQKNLEGVADSFDLKISDTLASYENVMDDLDIPLSRGKGISLPDLESLKGLIGLRLPPTNAVFIRFSAKIQTEATVRFRFYKIANFARKLIYKNVRSDQDESYLALRDNVAGLKRETEKTVIQHFTLYGDRVKADYFVKLVDSLSNGIYAAVLERLKIYTTDLFEVSRLVAERQEGRKNSYGSLEEMETRLSDINLRIDMLRDKVEENG